MIEIYQYSPPTGWSTSNQGCQTLQSESSCIGSKDGRDASHGIGDSHCDWCCGEACTSGSANKCEPHTWLLKQSSYTGKAKNGAGYNTCTSRDHGLLFCFFFMRAGLS